VTSDLYHVAQLALGLTFLFAGVSKLPRWRSFARHVVEYRILPDRAAYAFGLALVPVECAVGVGHLSGWLPVQTAATGALLLLTFTAAIGVSLARGRELACHCFGSGDDEIISTRALTRVLLMLGGECVLLFGPVLWGLGRSTQLPATASSAALDWIWALCLLLVVPWLLLVPEVMVLFKRSCPSCDAART
jgi:hypothetical protein